MPVGLTFLLNLFDITTMFKFIPWTLAVLSLALPVPVEAKRVGAAFDSQPAPISGECYGTANGSNVCWFRVANNTYSVAIQNDKLSKMPQSFLITCGGKWLAYGGFPEDHSQAFVDVFCRER